jgi:peptidoglycan hydrolase CwlO-like protein
MNDKIQGFRGKLESVKERFKSAQTENREKLQAKLNEAKANIAGRKASIEEHQARLQERLEAKKA